MRPKKLTSRAIRHKINIVPLTALATSVCRVKTRYNIRGHILYFTFHGSPSSILCLILFHHLATNRSSRRLCGYQGTESAISIKLYFFVFFSSSIRSFYCVRALITSPGDMEFPSQRNHEIILIILQTTDIPHSRQATRTNEDAATLLQRLLHVVWKESGIKRTNTGHG